MQKKDGMMYAPVGKTERVCAPGEFPIAVIGLDHGHIYGMCNGLIEAGADLCSVWDPDPDKMEAFQNIYGQVKCVSDKQQILDDEAAFKALKESMAKKAAESKTNELFLNLG